MIALTEAQRAVYYPQDRRLRIWIRPSVLLLLMGVALVPLILAWLQVAFVGLALHRAKSCLRLRRS